MNCQNCAYKNNVMPLCHRQAADRVWEMAKEYEAQGLKELADAMYEIAQNIHNLARSKQLECCINNLISK